MVHADEPPKPRRRRRKSPTAPVAEVSVAEKVVTSSTSPPPASLEVSIERERVQLMQVHAMLKCLYEVLLYADDDDSIMHADVANMAARLLDESVVRLELLRASLRQPATGDSPGDQPKEDIDVVPPRNHEVKELPAAYLC